MKLNEERLKLSEVMVLVILWYLDGKKLPEFQHLKIALLE